MSTDSENTGGMRVLFVSSLYPNPRQPARGVFNRHTVRALAEHVDIQVLAAVPWFPGKGSMAGIPERTDEDGVTVRHVRAFYTPGFLRDLHGKFFERSIRKKVLSIRREFPFDILYGSWIYPDGYAAVLLAKELNVPCVLHALGSDIHKYLDHPRRSRKIIAALSGADRIVCVSRYIHSRITTAGIPTEKMSVVYDGVDTQLFSPRDARQARTKLSLPVDARIILFVGNLTSVKGPDYLVDAVAKLKETTDERIHLVILGDGPLERPLCDRVRTLRLEKQVTFAGSRPHREIPDWTSAADLLCLSSLNEGMPNVILEALASGRPVVATDVGGVSEVIDSDEFGILVPPRDPEALARALREALSTEWDTHRLTGRAGQFSWTEHGTRISGILKEVVTKNPGD